VPTTPDPATESNTTSGLNAFAKSVGRNFPVFTNAPLSPDFWLCHVDLDIIADHQKRPRLVHQLLDCCMEKSLGRLAEDQGFAPEAFSKRGDEGGGVQAQAILRCQNRVRPSAINSASGFELQQTKRTIEGWKFHPLPRSPTIT